MPYLYPNPICALAVCLTLLLGISTSALAQSAPITSSGLNTQISGPISVGGNVQYDITGGTRPNGGPNLFHSFGDFSIPNNNIANFHNNSGLATANILGRVTGGNESHIFGAIRTSDFGSANLFLMNPAGFLFGPDATVQVGGMMTFTTADYLRLSNADGTNTGVFYANPASPSLLSASPVAAFGFLGSNPGAITVQGSHFVATEGTGIALVGGNISIESGTLSDGTVQRAQLSAPNGQIQLASTASPGEFGATLRANPNVNGTSFRSFGSVSLAPDSMVNVSSTDTVSIRGGQFLLKVNDTSLSTAQNPGDPHTVAFNGGSKIITSTSGIDPGVNVRIFAKNNIQVDGSSSGIFTDTFGTNTGGDITLTAHSVTLQNAATLSAMTFGTGSSATGGTITVDASNVLLTNNANISAGTSEQGNAGHINIVGTENITLENSFINNGVELRSTPGNGGIIQLASPLITMSNSRIRAATSGLGDAGNIDVAVSNLILTNNSQIQTRTTGGGNAGNVNIHGYSGINSSARDITLKGSSILSDTVGDNTYVEGNAGNIFISTGRLTLTESSIITTATTASSGSAGNIAVNAKESVTISQSSLESDSNFFSLGQAGQVTITSPNISVENGGVVTSTDYIGNAGDITLKTTTLNLTSGAHLASSSVNMAPPEFPELKPTGNAGTVTIEGMMGHTQSITMNGVGSGIFTETQGQGQGGNITLRANHVQLNSGAAITANSTGAANAGNINITATDGLIMQNSSITTLVDMNAIDNSARGGDIKITTSPTATVHLQDSKISASVPGSGDGGNVSIDPKFVILQGSQILAQTDRGTGGNITIIASVFQPDATSIVNADSGSGVNGTVTIQSPIAPASGKIQPIGNRPLQATLLLNQRCAALADGKFSSFTIAGRDSLPTEPGGLLSSPLVLGTIESYGSRMTDVRLGMNLNELRGERSPLWLRQIAPPRFLTNAFAENRFADCRS